MNIKAGKLETLVYELFGYTNPESNTVVIQGLIKEELPYETTKLQLKRFGKKLQEELKTFQESVKEIWEKYGDKHTDENGQESYKVSEEKVEDFRNAMGQILNADLEIEIGKLEESEFKFKSKTSEYSYTLLDMLFID